MLSLHAFESSVVEKQPVAGLHASSVQGFPSSQFLGDVPTQMPPLQTSERVQRLPSLHIAVLLTCAHPVDGLHESVVQTLPSLQLTAVPAQTPFAHVSAVVHALPSSHAAVPPFVCTQLPAGLHVSAVQGFWSSQYAAGRPRHEPEAAGAKRMANGTELASTLAAANASSEQAGASNSAPPRTVIPSASIGAATGLIRYRETCATRRYLRPGASAISVVK